MNTWQIILVITTIWVVISIFILSLVFLDNKPAESRREWWKKVLGSVFWPLVGVGFALILAWNCVAILGEGLVKLFATIKQYPAE